ncbi:hypothetical protein K2Z83_02080 [Oscillochloris sp. ZM17-4]|uniref:hypothetical protein n=1 Tax=Oscillochloris sp. ZM17-4 TaxID=2866714 RepID=UPI001C737B41|nr:hypothetical protein [Oscillochloris sp. ZM17-4]MBX0326481.1 hypothetical protein [Oscillochloris sp. ZM17-4]
MDWTLVAGIVAIGVVVILIALVMLNRAWGNFPGRVSGLPPAMPPEQPSLSRPSTFSAGPTAELEPPAMDLPAGAPAGSLVPVTHPMVRQAVMTAMERGGSPYALYFIRDGETLYLVPSRIADQRQREMLTRMFTSLNSDSDGSIGMGDIIRVMQDLAKK